MPEDDDRVQGQDPFERASADEASRPEPPAEAPLGGAPGAPPPPPAMPPGIGSAPPGSPQVVYVQQPAAPTGNGLAVAALVLGILAVVLFWTIWGGIILGVLAVIFGAVGRGKAKLGAPNKGLATAGLVLGAAGLIGAVLFIALIATVLEDSEDVLDRIEYCLDNPNDPTC